jgi:hypothetical protein
MKNNNLGRNNATGSNRNATGSNRNAIIVVMAFIFLIIVGGVIYYGWYKDDDENISAPVISSLNNTKGNAKANNYNAKANNYNAKANNVKANNYNTKGNNIPEEPGNVKFLDNIRNNTIEDELNNNQVYNLSNNIFTYDDAKAACKAHGSNLATYKQILNAYKKGGEWCNYGWSEGQMALYPTQKATWELLQDDPDSANSCGEWGVNGGYFENPNTLFGANCYGIKPEPKNNEKEKKLAFSNKQKAMLDKINMYKNQLNDMTVNPFNKNTWSEKGKSK